ncbi:MAG: DUF3418 domain-containing protein, partial [Micrococcales bacterium]|nr:DUF3418 domain-containing protein [Micrococcales bacterium]
ELIQATIRTLPKPVRVQLVPAPDAARAIDGWLTAHLASWEDTVHAADAAPSFHDAFCAAVRALRGVEIPPDAFDDERLPPHLRMTFRVIDAAGVAVDEGKDLLALQRRLVARSDRAVSAAVHTAVRAAMQEARAAAATHAKPANTDDGAAGFFGVPDGLTTWPDGLTLAEVVETHSRSADVKGYPALVDLTPTGGPVGVRVLGSPVAAAAAHRAGLRRLLLADVGLGTARITSRWTGAQALALASSPYPDTEALVADVQLAAIDALVPDPAGVRDPDSYAAVRARLREELEDEVHRLVGTLVGVLTAWREADAAVRSLSSLALVATGHDVRVQLDALVGPGFVGRTGAARLAHLVRYLRAATYRLAKAAEQPARDAALAAQVSEATAAYGDAVARAASGAPDPAREAALAAVRWQLEELRVSLFAQQLGTPEKVSVARIRRALAGLA